MGWQRTAALEILSTHVKLGFPPFPMRFRLEGVGFVSRTLYQI